MTFAHVFFSEKYVRFNGYVNCKWTKDVQILRVLKSLDFKMYFEIFTIYSSIFVKLIPWHKCIFYTNKGYTNVKKKYFLTSEGSNFPIFWLLSVLFILNECEQL